VSAKLAGKVPFVKLQVTSVWITTKSVLKDLHAWKRKEKNLFAFVHLEKVEHFAMWVRLIWTFNYELSTVKKYSSGLGYILLSSIHTMTTWYSPIRRCFIVYSQVSWEEILPKCLSRGILTETLSDVNDFQTDQRFRNTFLGYCCQ